MIHLNSWFTLFFIGLWASSVRCEDQAIAVFKLDLLGKLADMPPEVVRKAQGRITLNWTLKERKVACGKMNDDQVKTTAEIFYKKTGNKLSSEDPGTTMVYAVFPDQDSETSTFNIIGFKCKADLNDDSYSFVLVHQEQENAMTAYVPSQYIRET